MAFKYPRVTFSKYSSNFKSKSTPKSYEDDIIKKSKKVIIPISENVKPEIDSIIIPDVPDIDDIYITDNSVIDDSVVN